MKIKLNFLETVFKNIPDFYQTQCCHFRIRHKFIASFILNPRDNSIVNLITYNERAIKMRASERVCKQ